MEINHIISDSKGMFVAVEDDFQLGEIAFDKKDEQTIEILHTGVESSVKGQGIGKSLVFRVADYARENSLVVLPTCPFAKSIFQKNKEIQDVLVR